MREKLNDMVPHRLSGKTGGTLLGVITSAIIAAPVLATPSVAHAGEGPLGCISDRGYNYDNVVNRGLILDGKGTARIFQNNTASDATLALSQTASGTVQWSVNGSISGTAGYDFAVIKASVTAVVGGSYTTSNSVSQTVTVTITVHPHYYGILQGGVFRRYTSGHYYYDYGNCTYSTGSTIYTKLPVVADGYAATTNTTGVVPWDQQ